MPLLSQLLARASDLLPFGSRWLDAAAAAAASPALLREGMLRWHAAAPEPGEIAGGLLPWERAMAAHAVRPGDRILVVGSGTGRELLALAEAGHDVMGVEPSEPATRIAIAMLQQRGRSVPVQQGFFEDLPLAERFHVVLFSHRCYGLIQGSAARVAALRKAAHALEPGGRIVVSYAAATSRELAPHVPRLIAALMRSGVSWEQGDRVYRVAKRPARFAVEHAFAPGALEREAAAAALALEHLTDLGCPAAVLTPRVSRSAGARVIA